MGSLEFVSCSEADDLEFERESATPIRKTPTMSTETKLGSIHQEPGDYLLPQLVDYVKKNRWIDTRPRYQRRLVWDTKQKSLFMESLLLNLPVPPLFLFEHKYAKWEIMDGQQRTSAVSEFYNDDFALKGLSRWKSLNGLKYSECPDEIQRRFDRRRLHVVIVLAETDATFDVRKEVFERLNTGGRPLRPQEVRNCLYAGAFCDLLDELSSLPAFTTLWGIPEHKPPRLLKSFSQKLLDNKMFARMQDCELVLRFFALNSSDYFKSSVKGALDSCMEDYSRLSEDRLTQLQELFTDTIGLAYELFGAEAFHMPNSQGRRSPAKQLYDAIMSAMSTELPNRTKLVRRKKSLQKKLGKYVQNESAKELFLTQHDNKRSFNQRVRVVRDLIT